MWTENLNPQIAQKSLREYLCSIPRVSPASQSYGRGPHPVPGIFFPVLLMMNGALPVRPYPNARYRKYIPITMIALPMIRSASSPLTFAFSLIFFPTAPPAELMIMSGMLMPIA